jgi:hypothetical protein
MVLTSSCITCLCKDIKKNQSTCFHGQIVTKLLIGILFTITLASCNGSLINPFVKSDTPTPIPNPHSRPEPHEPIVTGTYSGLSDNELVRLYIRGTGGIQGTQRGNGSWEAVISNAMDGEQYVVTVEVEGYVSLPGSYTIIVQGKKAYIVKDGQITSEEAKKLDFHFTPLATPTHE